jgi:5S rRNA maturation endonuclease (ribonuclease M5)
MSKTKKIEIEWETTTYYRNIVNVDFDLDGEELEDYLNKHLMDYEDDSIEDYILERDLRDFRELEN